MHVIMYFAAAMLTGWRWEQRQHKKRDSLHPPVTDIKCKCKIILEFSAVKKNLKNVGQLFENMSVRRGREEWKFDSW